MTLLSMIDFEVTRDSVCMGDDVDAPHYAKLSLESNLPLKELVTTILNKYQLASVASPKVYWICKINGIHVATITVTEDLCRSIQFEEGCKVHLDLLNSVHFKYAW